MYLGSISCLGGLFSFFLVLVTAALFMTSIFSVLSPTQAEALLKTLNLQTAIRHFHVALQTWTAAARTAANRA